MRTITRAACGLMMLAGCQSVPTGEIVAVTPSTSSQVLSVYWLDRTTCTSRLRSVKSVTPAIGNADGLEFSLQPAAAIVPHQCPGTTMPGAFVTVRQTRAFAAGETRDITLVVQYETEDGNRSSTHVRRFVIVPTIR